MQTSLLAVITIFCFTRCQSQETAGRQNLNLYIVLKNELRREQRNHRKVSRPALWRDHPEPRLWGLHWHGDQPQHHASIITTTDIIITSHHDRGQVCGDKNKVLDKNYQHFCSSPELEGDNLSEADLEVNNVVQSALEPRVLELSPDLDYEAESKTKANSAQCVFLAKIRIFFAPQLSHHFLPENQGTPWVKMAEAIGPASNLRTRELWPQNWDFGLQPSKWCV